MKVVLLCNYAPDRQQSMLRFGTLLASELQRRGVEAVSIAPRISASARCLSVRGTGTTKWAGYLDKYVLAPRRLRAQATTASRGHEGRALVHVVDHSNALYLPQPRSNSLPWIVTCHDLLAVRGALGEDTDCPASRLGRVLQRAIVRGLSRAEAIVCDSTSTLQDVERLVTAKGTQVRRVILLGQNHPYVPVSAADARARLRSIGDVPWAQPFLLHVGSNLARKNKLGVWRVFARIAAEWPGNLVFCGAPLPEDVRAQAAAAGLASRVFAVPAPTNAELEAAYSLAHALLYPSRCEGFGWPIIEAQACDCPVICSDRTSLPEVGGEAALVLQLEDELGMAEAVLRLRAPGLRSEVIARGRANLARFASDRMVDGYLAVYEEVLAARRRLQ